MSKEFVSSFVTHFTEEWHETNATPKVQNNIPAWRLEIRAKTIHLALVMALNIGTDPPDVMRSSPCSRVECWIDPNELPQERASDIISRALQEQYIRWQPRARYKRCADPTIDFVEKLCKSMRRAAKDSRVLFHYNGRGVPKPSPNGELWFFNGNFTQYLPLSIYDLDAWNGNPAVYVFDCDSAGSLIRWLNEIIGQQQAQIARSPLKIPQSSADCIALAACDEGESLPSTLDLPADIFTACLTTPIKMALHWTCVRGILFNLDPEYIDDIPGHFNDRRSPLGELNWIFTAITDTIAWVTLPPALFRRLYRQDALVASLMRNFLLAERILKVCGCTPKTIPSLPPMHQHPLWNAWDVTVDFYLAQIPNFIRTGEPFRSNPFFPDQLTAFEIWLEFAKEGNIPEQLPIVLQVLLSKQHRERALRLLAKFLDLGTWAISLALSVGTFPYVLKLLQCTSPELREDLVFIWTKILVVDTSAQMDLFKEHAELYFIPFLATPNTPVDQKIKSAFILSAMMNGCPDSQQACFEAQLIHILKKSLSGTNTPHYNQWLLLCAAKLWENFPEAKYTAIKIRMPELLKNFLTDSAPLVRTAAVYAIGSLFVGPSENTKEMNEELSLALSLALVTADMTAVARKELIFTLIRIIVLYEEYFTDVVLELTRENMRIVAEMENSNSQSKQARRKSRGEFPKSIPEEKYIFVRIWRVFLSARNDPHPDCSAIARNFFTAFINKLSTLPEVMHNAQLLKFLYRLRNAESGPSSRRLSRRTSDRLHSDQRPRVESHGSRLDSFHGSGNTISAPGSPTVAPPSPQAGYESPIYAQASLDCFPSQFYDWSKQYFSKKFSDIAPEDDETSPLSLEKNWRRRKQQSYYEHTLRVKEQSAKSKFQNQIALINDSSIDIPSVMKLHPSEPICVFSDSKSNISVWNWSDSVRLSLFSNGSSVPVTAMSLINTQERFRVVAGSADGIIRVWGNVDDSPKLLSSWRAFFEDPSRVKRSLVFDWNNTENCLLTSGIVPIVRMWDIEKGLSVLDISVQNSPVTSLTHHKLQSLFVSGSTDGKMQLFDSRDSKYSAAMGFNEHKAGIVSARIPRTGAGTLMLSGCSAGFVKVWDLRKSDSSLRSIKMHSQGMTAFDVHEHAPIFATGGPSQAVKIVSYLNGIELSSIRYHTNLIIGQRIGPISSLSFHPHRLILAAGATDSIISMYQSSAYKSS